MERDITDIYEAYMRYKTICKNKLGKISDSRIISLRGEVKGTLDKCIHYLSSSKTSEVEKLKNVHKAKKAFLQYCYGLKASPNFNNNSIEKTINNTLSLLTEYEAEKMSILRRNHPHGEKINIQTFFEEDINLRQIISKTVDVIIKESFKNTGYTIIGEDKRAVYITAKGEKYHKKDCPFCKGKVMQQSTLNEVSNIGLKPCKCIELQEDNNLNDSYIEKDSSSLKTTNTITVFIDESVRKNYWSTIDETLPEKQGVYSFIICEGELKSEKEIDDSNILYKNITAVDNPYGTGAITINAITQSLMTLLALGKTGDILINTDNMEAKNTWGQNKENQNLSKYFSSVSVQYIPRELNTKADELGRQRIYVDLSEKFVKKILSKCNAYDELKRTLLHNEIEYSKI